MAYYTRTGDSGKTRIIGGHPYPKNHPRVETYGTVDELNSVLGLLISFLPSSLADIQQECQWVQQDLFDLGNDLAQIHGERPYSLKADRITWLEERIDHYAAALPPLDKFILPGGSQPASLAHICRTVCRRTERLCVGLFDLEDSSQENTAALRYLNRASDYFYVLARWLNHQLDHPDVEYINSKPVFTDGIRRKRLEAKNQQSKQS